MPPVVECETIVWRPVVSGITHELLAFFIAVLHFKNVGNCMDTPAITGLHGQCCSRRFLCLFELITLFQAERLHAQNIGVTDIILTPLR